jgi:hypothetical protein
MVTTPPSCCSSGVQVNEAAELGDANPHYWARAGSA